MSGFNLRRQPRISYYEPEEPALDEYVYCENCGDFVFEYCAVHGPLLVIPDTKVPANTGYPSFVPRAALTIPDVFLHIAPSVIPEAGLGVFATLTLPRGVRFGPYRGRRMDEITSTYCWQLSSEGRRRRVVVDAEDDNSSNWMRYVNCSRHWREQNLLAFQYRGDIYYRTIKVIPRFTELMVFYGSEFANELGVDLRKYNSPAGFAAKYGAPPAKKNKITDKTTQKKITITPEDKNIETEQKNRNMVLEKHGKTNGIHNAHNEESEVENNIEDIVINKPACSNIKKTVNNNITGHKQKFICDDCGKTFNNKSVLSKHIKQHNDMKSKIYFSCLLCKYQGITEKCLEKHMKRHDQSNISESNKVCLSRTIVNGNKITHECTICKYKSNQKKYLKTHLRVHTGEKPFACTICEYRCNFKTSLKTHFKTHTGEKSFACTICEYRCNVKSSLKRHLRVHTGEKPFACTICEYRCNVKSSLKTHLRVHTGEKPFACTICEYRCNQNIQLKKHLRVHTGEKPFACTICEYRCNVKSSLKTHLRVHTGEKPFACTICEYRCNQNIQLKKHLRVHTGEKPFACTICEYKCNVKSSLKTHLRVHTGEKPFACTICEYRCNVKSYLKTHLRVHTGEKPFACTICEYRCNFKISLNTHLKTHTGEKSFDDDVTTRLHTQTAVCSVVIL